MTDLDKVVSEAIAQFGGTTDAAELERIKARYLGKSGVLTEELKGVAKLEPQARREAGARVNDAKDKIERALVERREALARAKLGSRLAEEALDVTLPGRGLARGALHPATRTPTAPRSRPTSTTSPRSTRPRATRRARCTIPST
jgi:phenylalanyl-tRNA synthetase alpha chain